MPGARFVSYPGTAHALPRALWPAVLDEVEAFTRGAARTRAVGGG